MYPNNPHLPRYWIRLEHLKAKKIRKKVCQQSQLFAFVPASLNSLHALLITCAVIVLPLVLLLLLVLVLGQPAVESTYLSGLFTCSHFTYINCELNSYFNRTCSSFLLYLVSQCRLVLCALRTQRPGARLYSCFPRNSTATAEPEKSIKLCMKLKASVWNQVNAAKMQTMFHWSALAGSVLCCLSLLLLYISAFLFVCLLAVRLS